MKKLKLITLILLLSSNIFSQNTDDIVIAKKIKIQSTVLDEERTIFVSTPTGYDQSSSAYPVMYVLDGSETTIHFVSGLVGNLSERTLCPKMIIVAIENTDRFRDMAPTPYNRDPNRPSGGADKFLQFIENELFPYIEKEYRTLPYRIFKGHSASGMCVTYAFLSHNHMFNSYIAISPSMWWDSNFFSKAAEEKLGEMNFEHEHFYFSTGSKETAHNINGAQSFYEVLTKKNPKDLKWMFDHIQNEDHMSQGTIAMYNALRFIYNDWKFDIQKVRSIGLTYVDDFCQKQSEIYGYEISPSEGEMISIGYMMLRQKKFPEAIEIFQRNILKNPESANAYDCLGEVYLACEEFDLSIKNYEKAVQLGISNEDVSLVLYKQNLEKAKELESLEMQDGKKKSTKLKDELSTQTIVWKKLKSFPNTTSGAEPIILNNSIYYVPSSYAPRSITSDFYRYDIPSDTWVKLANMPEAKGNLAVAGASGKIYAIGGGFTKTNYEYTPETDTWQTLDSMPTARQHIDCGVVDNKIYVIGGITSFKDITKKNEVYDPETNTWSQKAPIPSLRNNPAIVTKDSLIYVIGGAGSEKSIWKTIATVECYNTKTDEWTSKSDMPFVLFKPGALVVENKIVVMGGQDASGRSLSSVLIYDIESDTWENTTPLPKINCFAGYASVGNKIYVIGGTTSDPDWTYYSDVYEGTLINSSNKK